MYLHDAVCIANTSQHNSGSFNTNIVCEIRLYPEAEWVSEGSTGSFLKRQILDSSRLKEFADDNFKFDENARKLSKHVENTVGKG